jgi:NADPH:quinone reductase
VPDELEPGALIGRFVLVAGGAGAVGHAAIQLAVWAGATVITTVSSPAKATLAHAAGARHVINYRTEDALRSVRSLAPDGVDIIVEVNPGANMQLDQAVTAPNATISVYSESQETITVPVRPSMTKNLRYQFILTYSTPPRLKAAAVTAVRAAVADGALAIGEDAGLPIRRFTLDETAAAHDAVEQGFVGKVLIDVD